MKSLAIVALLAGVAHADGPTQRPEAFEVDRDAPPPGQAEFSFDGGAPVEGWALSAQLGFLDRPMRLHTVKEKVFPVEQRETLALGGALALGPSVGVDARVPIAPPTGDGEEGLGGDRPLDRWVAGDLAVGLRLRIMHRERYAAFVRGQATFGTGNDYEFAGEARFTAAWMLVGRVMLPQGIVVAATGGVRFRRKEVEVADRLLGDELFAAVGASYALPAIRGLYCDANHVRITGELVGVLGNDVADRRGASPAEARVGVVTDIRPWLAVAVRAGKGIDDQIGAPRFRAMIEVVYRGAGL
jgi:hypothetical protein